MKLESNLSINHVNMLRKFVQIPFLLVIVTTTICYQTKQSPSSSSSLTIINSQSYRDQTIGCLYSDTVCSIHETCFDDHAFGRCEQYNPINGKVNNDYTYQLDRKTFQLLEQELTRLSSQNFDWPDPYTQCILKTILNDRPRVVYDPTVCDVYLPSPSSLASSTTNQPLAKDDENWFLELPVLLAATTKVNPSKSPLSKHRSDIQTLSKKNLLPVIIQHTESINSTPQPTIDQSDHDSRQRLIQLSRRLLANNNQQNTNNQHKQLPDYEDDADSTYDAENNQPLVAYLKQIIQQQAKVNLVNLQKKTLYFMMMLMLMVTLTTQAHDNTDSNNDDDDQMLLNDHSSYRDDPVAATIEQDEQPNIGGHYSWSSSMRRIPEIRVSRDTSNDDHDDNIDLSALFGTLPLNDDDVVVVDFDDNDDNLKMFDNSNNDDDSNEDHYDSQHLLPLRLPTSNDNDDSDNDENSDVDDDDDLEEKEVLLSDINYSNNYLMPNFNRNHRYDTKKPGPIYVEEYWFQSDGDQQQQQSKSTTQQSIVPTPQTNLSMCFSQ